MDEKKGQNPYFSSRNTTSSSTYYDDDWYKYSWGCADEDGDHETEAKAEREAARKVTEDRWILFIGNIIINSKHYSMPQTVWNTENVSKWT